MKITGELLKSERLKQGLSVQDVAFALKLSSKIITSIESGRLDELPAKTFVRGFVKSYAQMLKIDVDQVMRQFQEEMGSTHPLPKTPPPLPTNSHANPGADGNPAPPKRSTSMPPTSLNADNSRKTFVFIGLAVVLVVLIITTNRIVEKYQKDAVIEANGTQIKPLDNPAIVATPINSTNVSSVPVSSDTSSGDTASAAAPVNAATAATPIAESLESSSTLVISPEEGFEATAGKPVEVIIEAKKSVELLYAKGSSKSFSRLQLQPKQIQIIRSPDGLYLKAEDGGALHLTVNGVEKGTAGSSNKPVKLTF